MGLPHLQLILQLGSPYHLSLPGLDSVSLRYCLPPHSATAFKMAPLPLSKLGLPGYCVCAWVLEQNSPKQQIACLWLRKQLNSLEHELQNTVTSSCLIALLPCCLCTMPYPPIYHWISQQDSMETDIKHLSHSVLQWEVSQLAPLQLLNLFLVIFLLLIFLYQFIKGEKNEA